MPVILDPDSFDLWLDPGMRDVAAASELLKPYDARLIAVLSRQHANQPRGERRRSLLRARGTRPDSESSLPVVVAVSGTIRPHLRSISPKLRPSPFGLSVLPVIAAARR